MATLIDDEGLSAIGADQLVHSRVSMTQDRGIAERLSDTDTCRPLDLFGKHPGEISRAVDQVGRPVKKSLDIERRQNLSDLLGCRQRAQIFTVATVCLSSRTFLIRSYETVTVANVPKRVPKRHGNGPRRSLRGPLSFSSGDRIRTCDLWVMSLLRVEYE